MSWKDELEMALEEQLTAYYARLAEEEKVNKAAGYASGTVLAKNIFSILLFAGVSFTQNKMPI